MSRTVPANPESSTQSQDAAPGIGLSVSTSGVCSPPFSCNARSTASITGGANRATFQADYSASTSNGDVGTTVQAGFDPWIAEYSGVYTHTVRESTTGSTTAIGAGTDHNLTALFNLNTPFNPDVSPISLLWYNPAGQCQAFTKSGSLLEVYTVIRSMGECPGNATALPGYGRYCLTDGTAGTVFAPGTSVGGAAGQAEWCMNQSLNLIQSETRTISILPGRPGINVQPGLPVIARRVAESLGLLTVLSISAQARSMQPGRILLPPVAGH